MAERSDFKRIDVRSHIGNNPGPIPGFPSYTFDGPSVQRDFTAGEGVTDGYILLQVFGVQRGSARIKINGQGLPDADILAGPDQPSPGPEKNKYWHTWWDSIPDGIMQEGDNTLVIEAGSGSGGLDDIAIRDVVIHYRESD